MRNFDTELDLQGTTRRIIVSAATTVTVREQAPAPTNQSKTHLFANEQAWTWDQLRDYVVTQIEERHGAFPRDAVKEAAIFKAFCARWGTKAAPIARCAFEVHGGWWRSAPIGVNRFSKNSDPFFAEIIAQAL